MNKAFGMLIALAALAISIVSLIGTMRVKETVAQAECRHQCERERDAELFRIQARYNGAIIFHYEKLRDCRSLNVGNETAMQQCQTRENERFSSLLAEFAAESNRVYTAFITCTNNCVGAKSGTPAPK